MVVTLFFITLTIVSVTTYIILRKKKQFRELENKLIENLKKNSLECSADCARKMTDALLLTAKTRQKLGLFPCGKNNLLAHVESEILKIPDEILSISRNKTTIPPSLPTKVFIDFSNIPKSSKKLTFFIRIGDKLKIVNFIKNIKRILNMAFNVVLSLFGIILILAIIIYLSSMQRTCTNWGEITNVGGCDIFGNCAVSLYGGYLTGTSYKPVKGQLICTSYKWKETEPSITNFWDYTIGRIFFREDFTPR